MAHSSGELHPVIGLWPVALAEDLEEQLGKRRAQGPDWTNRHGTVARAVSARARLCDIDIDPFFNANTPQELDQLRAHAGAIPRSRHDEARPAAHARYRHRRLEEIRQDDAGRHA